MAKPQGLKTIGKRLTKTERNMEMTHAPLEHPGRPLFWDFNSRRGCNRGDCRINAHQAFATSHFDGISVRNWQGAAATYRGGLKFLEGEVYKYTDGLREENKRQIGEQIIDWKGQPGNRLL